MGLTRRAKAFLRLCVTGLAYMGLGWGYGLASAGVPPEEIREALEHEGTRRTAARGIAEIEEYLAGQGENG